MLFLKDNKICRLYRLYIYCRCNPHCEFFWHCHLPRSCSSQTSLQAQCLPRTQLARPLGRLPHLSSIWWSPIGDLRVIKKHLNRCRPGWCQAHAVELTNSSTTVSSWAKSTFLGVSSCTLRCVGVNAMNGVQSYNDHWSSLMTNLAVAIFGRWGSLGGWSTAVHWTIGSACNEQYFKLILWSINYNSGISRNHTM